MNMTIVIVTLLTVFKIYTMKKLFLLTALLVTINSYSQTTSADEVAARIADKMKDSLLLSTSQRNNIYSVNLYLNNQKQIARQKYSDTDSLRYHIQVIENSRDSLYKKIIYEEKYLLYKEKKRNLINSN